MTTQTTTATPLQRIAAWPEAFAQLLGQRHLAPFAWGTHDCCIFAADCVHAVTGVDFAKGLRGTYATALYAERVLQKQGGVEGIARAALGEPRASVAYAGRADVVCAMLDGRATLGVCIGQGRMAVPGANGLVYLPIPADALVWSV